MSFDDLQKFPVVGDMAKNPELREHMKKAYDAWNQISNQPSRFGSTIFYNVQERMEIICKRSKDPDKETDEEYESLEMGIHDDNAYEEKDDEDDIIDISMV